MFDASAKTVGPSLNECLHKGPQLTPFIFDILLRFRTYPVALTADIEKAFLQIAVTESDRNYLRFLWFDDVFKDEPVITRNRFARVVFGVSSSPFNLNGTIHKHLENFSEDTEFFENAEKSFYVDDYVGGENDVEKTFQLCKKLKERFLEGHFALRKWRTNSKELRDKIFVNIENGDSHDRSFEKVLGIPWDDLRDVFCLDFSKVLQTANLLRPTKRNVLRIVSSFYDPLGFIQPLIINLKILLQEICKLKLDWDTEIDETLTRVLDGTLAELKGLDNLQVARRIEEGSDVDPVVLRELHGLATLVCRDMVLVCMLDRFVNQEELT